MPVGTAKFDLNRCNESPLRGEKPDFWPVSKDNTGSLPLRGNPVGNEENHHSRPIFKTNKLRTACFMFKVNKQQLPSYFNDLFIQYSALHSHNTKQSYILQSY